MTFSTSVGRITVVQIALATQLPMRDSPTAEILSGHGIVGDRYENARHRQVTVQSLEEIALAEEELGRPLDARLTRRNITVNMGLLDRTPGARLRLGTEDLGWIELEVVRDAAPCKILEDNLGRDAKLALHKRAGVVCRTITGGTLTVGQELQLGEAVSNVDLRDLANHR